MEWTVQHVRRLIQPHFLISEGLVEIPLHGVLTIWESDLSVMSNEVFFPYIRPSDPIFRFFTGHDSAVMRHCISRIVQFDAVVDPSCPSTLCPLLGTVVIVVLALEHGVQS